MEIEREKCKDSVEWGCKNENYESRTGGKEGIRATLTSILCEGRWMKMKMINGHSNTEAYKDTQKRKVSSSSEP